MEDKNSTTGELSSSEIQQISGETVADSLHAAVEHAAHTPLIENDAVIFGFLMMILGFVFFTSSSKRPALKTFYKFVPMLLLCYFLPSLLTLFGVVNPERSNLYYVASRYFLPASLILLTLSIDLGGILRLGPKALVMFLTGTVGVVLGGPIAVLLVSLFAPGLVGGETWKGLSTVAGSWIGGGANQLAMEGIFKPEKNLFTAMIAVDVLVAEFWMIFLLLGVGKADAIDRKFKADSSSIRDLQERMEKFSEGSQRIPTTTDLVVLAALIFGGTGLCHLFADSIAPFLSSLADFDPARFGFVRNMSLGSSFFWLILSATTLGLCFSFTRVREYEGVGAMKLGTVFIFILVAVIGMSMDLAAVVKYPGFFLVGLVWMAFHVGLMFLVGWMIRAPYFFLAVGSKANIGGAASAPVVAGAFHPSLAPVGVLLATVGYALGTYGAYLCALMMKALAPEAAGID
ncbi:MAG: DUF819 family protein [Planctomycetota bacterium]|nr:DUF819 family protein [Planctomycetota bacterium]